MELKHLQLTGFLTIFIIAPGLAIRCFDCNSKHDKECISIKEESIPQFVKDCDSLDDGHTYTLCRKIDMYMDAAFGEGHPAENRVHRACGYMEGNETNSCYYKSGYNTRSWVCSCDTDDCNSVADMKPLALLILASAAILYKST